MKTKFLPFLASALALTSVASPAMASDKENATLHRPFYGFFMNNADFPLHSYGFGELFFDDTTDATLLYDFYKEGTNPIYAGAGVDGILYGMGYVYNGAMNPTTPGQMIAYNTFNGRMTVIGNWGDDADPNFKPQDLTYDYTDGKLYGAFFRSGATGLYEINTATAEVTKVTDLSIAAVTLAASPAGELYSIDINGILYKINKENGKVTKIFDTGFTGFNFVQSMEFDRTSGLLYWASNASSNDKSNVQLMEINIPEEGDVTMFAAGQLGSKAVFNCLYIPAATSFDAPAAPTGFTVTPGEGFKANLSWTNPTTTYGNDPIEGGLNGVVIYRNNEVIKTLPGDATSYTDESVTESGEYRYDVMALNAKGNGMKATAFQYLGEDSPAAVGGIAVDVANGFMSAAITWEPTTKGYHDGNIDLSKVKYKVTRLPDNFEVAKDLTEPKATDTNFRRTLAYTYVVEAYNEIGTSPSVASEVNIIGPAYEVPFEESFEQQAITENRWMLRDGNDDTCTWMFNTSAGHTFFGDYETGLEYMLSPLVYDESIQDADDWVISGPIKFEAGKSYSFVLKARNITPETGEVYFGPSQKIEDLELLKSIDLKVPEMTEDMVTVHPNAYIVDLPTTGVEIGCVAFRLTTPVPDNHYSFLQINSLEVLDRDKAAVEAIGGDNDVKVVVSGDVLAVAGDFTTVAVYAADGRLVLETADNNTSIASLPAGVYVAAVKTPAGVKTVKFAR